MEQGKPSSALMFAAILAFGVVVAYGLHRVSADVAAITVLSCSAILACVVSSGLSFTDQWVKVGATWLEQFHLAGAIDFRARSNFDIAKENK